MLQYLSVKGRRSRGVTLREVEMRCPDLGVGSLLSKVASLKAVTWIS